MNHTKLRLLAATLAFCLPLTACSAPAQGSSSGTTGSYTAGTYSATVTGMHEMTVQVTFSDNEMTDIQIDHSETPGIGEPATQSIPAQILECQGLCVDIVGGATLTSNAILQGVADCV